MGFCNLHPINVLGSVSVNSMRSPVTRIVRLRPRRLGAHVRLPKTSLVLTVFPAGIAVLQIPVDNYTMTDPRVWLLDTNRALLGSLLEQAFHDRYASYDEEAVPLLDQALLARCDNGVL